MIRKWQTLDPGLDEKVHIRVKSDIKSLLSGLVEAQSPNMPKSENLINKLEAVPSDKTEKRILESSICKVCDGVIRLPALSCNKCQSSYC